MFLVFLQFLQLELHGSRLYFFITKITLLLLALQHWSKCFLTDSLVVFVIRHLFSTVYPNWISDQNCERYGNLFSKTILSNHSHNHNKIKSPFLWNSKHQNAVRLLLNYFVKINVHFGTNIQERLLNKPYVNEDILTGQNPPWKCYYPLEIFTQFEKGLGLLMLKIWGL